MFTIEPAVTPAQIDDVRTLFLEYEQWLGFSLCFQGFEEELSTLPGRYAAPGGALLIATQDDRPAGCIGMRSLGDRICEMKRLYVRDESRGTGIGRSLIEKLIDAAKGAGYERMRLDTYPSKMGMAVRLYESYGFYPIEPYYENPHKDIYFMEMAL